MSDGCYVITVGEVIILKGLSSNDVNGSIGTVEGISEQRIAIRLLHNKQKILVKPENILEGGGETVEDGSVVDVIDDNDDYNSDGEFVQGTDIDMSSDAFLDHDVPENENDDKDLEQAHALLLDINLDQAINLCESSPTSSCDYISQIKKARGFCQTTIEQNPDNWLAYEILGDLCINLQNYEEAVEMFNLQLNILSKNDSHSKAMIGMKSKVFLKLAMLKGRLSDSVGELEMLVNASIVDSTNVSVWTALGSFHSYNLNFNDAIKNFRQAVKLDLSSALGRFHLARALFAAGEKKTALCEIEAAVNSCSSRSKDDSIERSAKIFMMISRMVGDIIPSPIGASELIAKALLRSINLLQKAEKTDEDTEHRVLQALVYYQLGQSLELQGSNVSTGRSSSAAQFSGCYDGAISAYKRSCELDENDCSYKLALGNALRLRAHRRKSIEDLNDSIIVYQSGLLQDSENAALHRNLACSQMQKGLTAEAISSFTLSLQVADEDDPWSDQITQIIKDLSDKLRLNNQGTIVIDLPR